MMLSFLLIDDNPIDLLVNRRVIQNAFGEVSIISKYSALEALEYLREQESIPDYILLDIKMPLMDGFEFLEVLKKELQHVPQSARIFMVSSSIDPQDIGKAGKDDAIVEFLSKPLKLKDVKSQIQ